MLLVWMSFAGLVPVILFFITWCMQKETYNYMLGKNLLFLSLLFYIIPFPLLTRFLPDSVYYTASDMIPGTSADFHFSYGNDSYIAIHDGVMWIPDWVIIVFIAWAFCIFVFAVCQVVRYRRAVDFLLSVSEETVVDGMKIRVSEVIPTAYAVGFFHVYILVPEELLDSEYFPYIYRHEYCHAKNHDALVKLVCLVIVCVYWFNPLTYLLIVAFNLHCEYVSDDYAMEGCAPLKRIGYAEMLVNRLRTKPEKLPVVWRNSLISTRFKMQRRILYVMNRRKKFQRFTAVAVTAAAVLVSSIAVFAYSPMQSSNDEFVIGLNEGDFVDIIDIHEVSQNSNNMIDYDFSSGDTIIADEDGKTIDYENCDADTYALCRHDFVDIMIYKHISDGEGGCQVRQYKGQRCKKCNYIKQEDLVNIITYAVCIH